MAVDINGDGLIALGGTSTTQGRLRLAEDTDNGTNYVELTANAAVTTNRTVTFPDANIDFTTGLGAAQGGTGLTSAGTAGNVLTSNGSAWVSQATSGGYSGPNATVYASGSGTFTIPSGITRLKVTVIGGGGGGGNRTDGGGGGGGGAAIKWLTSVTPGNTLAYAVGAGGAVDNTGSTSSVSSGTQSITTISATGGTSPAGIGCGVGGAGSNGDLNISGNGGGYRGYNDGNSGGGSLYAGGGAGANSAGGGRQAGQPYGGGGGAQNAGATGVVVFEY